jgi:hypothetical protein
MDDSLGALTQFSERLAIAKLINQPAQLLGARLSL